MAERKVQDRSDPAQDAIFHYRKILQSPIFEGEKAEEAITQVQTILTSERYKNLPSIKIYTQLLELAEEGAETAGINNDHSAGFFRNLAALYQVSIDIITKPKAD